MNFAQQAKELVAQMTLEEKIDFVEYVDLAR